MIRDIEQDVDVEMKMLPFKDVDDSFQVRERRGSDVSDIFLSPEAYKATQVEYNARQCNFSAV